MKMASGFNIYFHNSINMQNKGKKISLFTQTYSETTMYSRVIH